MNNLIHRMCQYGETVVGPVMYRYVYWVLHEAQEKNIKTLYFLARDGYSLYKIAVKLCEAYDINIECRYLYCSRLSLRTASYGIIDKSEAEELLLLGGCYYTAKSILLRGNLNEQEINQLCNELNIGNPDEPLSLEEFKKLTRELKQSETYWNMVVQHAAQNLKNAIGYFTQEKMLEQEHLAIVDSGWTGTMQRSIRQILSTAGFEGKLTGFYFGMFSQGKETIDGEYCTFYFDKNRNTFRKVMFNNNLFECMLAAPHGMTLQYQYKGKRYEPILGDQPSEEMLTLIKAQHDGIMKYVESRIKTDRKEPLLTITSTKECQKILRRCMVYPTKMEIELFQKFLFCDDVTESYQMSLTDAAMVSELKEYTVFRKVMRKIFPCKEQTAHKALFWPYATIRYTPKWLQPWYQVNIFIWEYLRFKLR